MAWVTPRTWTAGETVTAAKLNETRDDLLWLGRDRPRARIYSSAPPAAPTGTATFANLNTFSFNVGSFGFPALGYMTPPLNGEYVVMGYIDWPSNATGYRQIRIWSSATIIAEQTFPAVNGTRTIFQCMDSVSLLAANGLSVDYYQNSGVSLTPVAVRLSAYLLGYT